MRRTLDAIYVKDLMQALEEVEPDTPIIVNKGYESDMGTLVGRSMLRLGGGNLFIFLDPEGDTGIAEKPLFRDDQTGTPKQIKPSTTPLLTPQEMAVLDILACAYNAFVELPVEHPMHQQEFAHAIHAAQRIVMSRPVARHYGWTKLKTPGTDSG